MDLKQITDADLREVCQGKTKIVYEMVAQPSLVLVRSKDRITAHNGQQGHDLQGKAAIANKTTCAVFDYLRKCGLRTHFVREHSATEFIAERCAMIPIEWVTRRVATGSFLKRNLHVKEGFRFAAPKLEIFLKDDANNDPQWSFESLQASGMTVGGLLIGNKEIEYMSRATTLVFEVLEHAWRQRGCTLVDMKIEFGINENGDIVLADVIDSDSWRLWPDGDPRLAKDKQFYRNLHVVTPEDLSKLKSDYDWVMKQLAMFSTAVHSRCVVLMGSESDLPFCQKIRDACEQFGIATVLTVTSAHKDPATTLATIKKFEGCAALNALIAAVKTKKGDGVPTVFVCVAGRSNGLGPVTAGNTVYPVINCPPITGSDNLQDVWSSLRMPSGVGCLTVLGAENAALAAATVLANCEHAVWARLRVKQLDNFVKLQKAAERAECLKHGCAVNGQQQPPPAVPVINGAHH